MTELKSVTFPTLVKAQGGQNGPYPNPSSMSSTTSSISTTTPPLTSTTTGSITKGSTGHEGTLPTINLEDFVSLLNPKNVKSCICCNTSLLSNGPPAFLSGKKSEILRSFCDILNLPYLPSNYNNSVMEEDSEETLDFPFCSHCTNYKIVKLTNVYEKLLLQQGHFDKLKEAVMKDILRVFISNMVLEKKVHLQTVRETRTHERMFNLFKRHSDRKIGNAAEKAVQTEYSSQFIPSTLYIPPASNVVEVSCSYNVNNSKRRRTTPRKSESHQYLERSVNRRPSLNTSHPEQYQYSPIKQSYSSNIPMSSGESSSSFNNPATSVISNANYNNNPQWQSAQGATNIQDQHADECLPVNESNSFENAINGVMFMLDENGMLELEDGYLPGVDFAQSFDAKENISMNGLPSFDQSTLSDEFQSVLGLMEGLGGECGDGTFSMEVEIPPTEPIVGRKSSPQKAYMSDEFVTGENQISISSSSLIGQDGIRLSGRKIKVTCEVCDKVMDKESFKQHMEKVHGAIIDEKPYKCRGCDKRFARRDHYLQHEERHMTNSKRIYFCHRCGSESKEGKIAGKTIYINHCVTNHGIEDDVVEFFHFCDADDCLESFKVRADFIEHLEKHWAPGTSLKCTICEKPFAEKKRLEAHQHEAHRSNEPYYNCQFCHMGFEEESDFSRHIIFHKVKIPEERTHTCETCGKAFETHIRLRSHRYNVHNKRIKKQKSRKGKTKLESPIQSPSPSQNNHELESPPPVNAAENTNKSTMSCDICGRKYRCKIAFKRHVENHPPKINKEEVERNEVLLDNSSTIDGKYACTYCSKKLKTTHEFRRHLVTRHKDKHLAKGAKHCIVCWNIFSDDDELQEHFELKHKKFKCLICGKMNPNSVTMGQHMARHNGKYPYTCPVCEQGFKGESALKMHSKKCNPNHSREILKISSPSDADSDLEEDLEELSNTLTPINETVNELFNSHDPNSYDMLQLFQM